MLKTRILVIISVGISVGFLLGMGVSSLLRAMVAGGDRGLEMTFTALVVLMAGILITYGLRSIPESRSPVEQANEVHLTSPQAPDSEVEETTPIPVAAVESSLPNGIPEHPEAMVNGKHTPVGPVPADVEQVVN